MRKRRPGALRCLLSGQGGHPRPPSQRPLSANWPFCRYQLPPAVSKVRFQDLSAQISGSARVSCCPLKALFGSRSASMAAFGMKKCENVLVAAVCELVGSLEPRSQQPPSPPPTSPHHWIPSTSEGRAGNEREGSLRPWQASGCSVTVHAVQARAGCCTEILTEDTNCERKTEEEDARSAAEVF